MKRVSIRWTNTARQQLEELPPKVRKGLISKADGLLECDDPRSTHKPLFGSLQGCYRITYARYRAVYTVAEEELANGDVLVHIKITFIAAGKRKEHDKKDIYRIAQKMVDSGFIPLEDLDGPRGPTEP